MQKINFLKTLLFACLVFCFSSIQAQILNETADWGAAGAGGWVITNGGETLLADPNTSDLFGYDDDAEDASPGLANTQIITSPVIDLTAAVAGAETNLEFTTPYDYTFCCSTTFSLEYFDADAAAWVLVCDLPATGASAVYKDGTADGSATCLLDISTFTATQQAGFQYRYNYDNSIASWAWGFILGESNVTSSGCTPPTYTVSVDDSACPNISIVVDVTDLGSALSVDITESSAIDSETAVGIGTYTLTGYAPGAAAITVTVADNADATCSADDTASFPAACPPANNDCANATPITVIASGSCPGAFPFTTVAASESVVASCEFGGDLDVWYSFTSPGTELVFESTSGLPGIQLFDACGGLEVGACLNNVSGTITGLTAGTTYLAMIWTDGTTGATGEFCLYELNCTQPTATFNVVDDCVNGFTIDVDVTSLGTATTVDITDGTTTLAAGVGLGVINIGPFTNGTPVDITVVDAMDATCNIVQTGLSNTPCPIVETVTCGTQSTGMHCYDDLDAQTWTYTSSDGISPLVLSYLAGGLEGCCDNINVYDGTDNTGASLFSGNNGGDLTGLTIVSTGPSIFIEIASDGSVSCAAGSTCCTTAWDWTVDCSTCTPPVANTPVQIEDCANTQFFVDIEVTDLGDGTPAINDGINPSTPVTALGVVTMGPYATGTAVTFTLEHGANATCDVVLATPVALPLVAGSVDNIVCNGTTFDIEASFSGGLADYDGSMFTVADDAGGPGGMVASGATYTTTGVPAGTLVTYTITDANGCVATLTYTTPTVTAPVLTCPGTASCGIDATLSADLAPEDFALVDIAFTLDAFPGENTFDIIGASGIIYSDGLAGTEGSVQTISVFLPLSEAPFSIDFTDSYGDGMADTCFGDTDGIDGSFTVSDGVTVSGPFFPVGDGACGSGVATTENFPFTAANISTSTTGVWSGAGVTDNMDGTAVFNSSADGTFTATYTYTDLLGCTFMETCDVTVSDCSAANPCVDGYETGNQLTGTLDMNADYETDQGIDSDQMIGLTTPAIGVDYDAAIDIDLLPGFEVALGVEFDAFIDGCQGGTDDGAGGNQVTGSNPVQTRAIAPDSSVKTTKHYKAISTQPRMKTSAVVEGRTRSER